MEKKTKLLCNLTFGNYRVMRVYVIIFSIYFSGQFLFRAEETFYKIFFTLLWSGVAYCGWQLLTPRK